MREHNLDNGIALGGYDPVSYFKSTLPVEGKVEFEVSFEGAVYRFENAENKVTFEANPNTYTPQYGGWCAVAMSEGAMFPVNPQTYVVEDNKLFLFYNGDQGNTKPQWEESHVTMRPAADKAWEKGDLKKG